MILDQTEMITYTTAEEMAQVYRVESQRIIDSLRVLGEATGRLKELFANDYGFGLHLEFHGSRYSLEDTGIDKVLSMMKCDAWKGIIDKINIRRLMSSKRSEELSKAFSQRDGSKFPDVTPEAIEQVVKGYVESATEFLEEAIREEYDWWRPSRRHHDYKRNSEWKLNKKIIRPHMVERQYGGGFRFCYHNQQHATALDNIFHMLDGNGPVKEFKGDLVSSVEATRDASGESKYFAWKCFGNGNLHLTFKRDDLLDMFNKIAAKSNVLGQAGR